MLSLPGVTFHGMLTHLDEAGRPRMVDVTAKDVTDRTAVAEGVLVTRAETLDLIGRAETPKGDPLVTASIAGIQAAKRTSELIPLCHPLPISSVHVEITPTRRGYQIEARVRTNAQTGVEMEALTAAAVGLLTVYDMVKAVDRGMTLADIRLEEKHGGKSGVFRRRRS